MRPAMLKPPGLKPIGSRSARLFHLFKILVFGFVLITAAESSLAGNLYTAQELEKLGELWTESKMIFDAEMSGHIDRVKQIQTMELNDSRKAVLLKREYARHDTLSEAFAETRNMVQSALIDESNARLGNSSNAQKIHATAGKQAGDKGYRRGESDLDAGGSERAVRQLKEVVKEMGLDYLLENPSGAGLKKNDTAGVLELKSSFELTINKTGLAAKPGSQFHQMTTAVDARHPETFLSQKLLHKDQAGAAYIEVQDHLKKAGKGHLLSGDDMIRTPDNMEKARIMCKSTRKVIDMNLVDDAALSKILKQNGMDLSPSQFRDEMFKIESSAKGRLTAELNDPNFLEKAKRVSQDVFFASEKNSFKTARQEIVDLRNKAANQPEGSGLKQAFEDEILDSVAKIKEGQAANREFRKNSGASDKSRDWDQLFDPQKRPGLAREKLDNALDSTTVKTSGTGTGRTDAPETTAKIFKAYNDLNDAVQMAQIVEDYMEGKASLSKTLLYATASIADMTVTQGAAGAILQSGERIDDLEGAKSSKKYAEQKNMELYLNQFAIEFRKSGMSKKDAVDLVNTAVSKNDLSILKSKIQQLKKEGKNVRQPDLYREKGIKADDTFLERADAILVGGGGQKIYDAWTAWDDIDDANRTNLEHYLTQWELTLRKAGVGSEEAKKMVGKAILLDDFSILQEKALELKAQGKDVSLPVLRHETIEPDDTVWDRVQNFGLTKHTILAPSRVVDAWAKGELKEADLDMRAISQKAGAKTDMFKRLLKAEVDPKRALLAVNNWDDGNDGLLEKVIKEGKANIKKKQMAEDELTAARKAEALEMEKLKQARLEIQKVLGWLRDLKTIKYQIECDPYPITFKKGQERVSASVVVTSKQNPDMIFSAIKASLQSVFAKQPATRIEYRFSLPGKEDKGILALDLPAKEALYPLDAIVTTIIESADPVLAPVNRQFSVRLPVDLQVIEDDSEPEKENAVSKDTDLEKEQTQKISKEEPFAWFLIDIVDYDPVEAREKNNSNMKIPYRRDSSYGRGSYYKKDTYRGRTDTWPDPDMVNGEYCAIQANWSPPPAIIYADKKVSLNVSIACAGKDLSYFGFGGSTSAIFDHENIRPGYGRYNIKFTDKDGKSYFAVDGKSKYATITREVSAMPPAASQVENNRMALIIGFPTSVGSLGTKYVYEWKKMGSSAPKFSPKDLGYPHPPAAPLTPKNNPADKKNENKKTPAKTGPEKTAATPSVTQPVLPHPPDALHPENIPSGPQTSVNNKSDSSLTLNKTRFLPGETITVQFTASKDFPKKAWVGLFPANVPHIHEKVTHKKYLTYQYVNGRTQGTLSFTAPTQTGSYDFRMHDKDKGAEDIEVATIAFTVTNPSFMSVAKNTFTEGEDIQVSFGVGKANTKDWIGIFAKDADPRKYISYQYTKGQTKGELIFPAKTPGEFRLGFYGKDKWEKLAPDVFITVTEGKRALTVNPSSFKQGASIPVSFTTPLPHPKDWIGLYRVQNADKKYTTYIYTKGLKKGTLTFKAPAETGEFEFRFFEKDGWNKVAVSNQFTITK